MRKFRHAYIDLYRANFYFIKCSAKYYRDLAKEEFECNVVKPDGGGRFDVFEKEGCEIGVIWINEWKHLSHEIFHAAHWLLQSRGLWLTDASEEAYSYLIEYLDNKFRE